jgi:hypothetical protein
MGKIQNTRPRNTAPRQRAHRGAVVQAVAPGNGSFGSVKAILQRGPVSAPQWVAPNAPSLAVQAEAAARQRRLREFPVAQQAQLDAAFAQLSEGRGIPSEPSFVAEALSSGVLRRELGERAAQLREAASTQQLDERTELSERDYVMLHVRPSAVQNKLSDELQRRLAACTTRSAKPSDLVSATRATNELNEYILNQVWASSASEGGSTQPVVSLKVVLGDKCSIISDDGTLSEETMRCRCLLSALSASGLLQPEQVKKQVLLAGGLAIDVMRQADAWQQVEVVMSGLNSNIALAEASFFVSELLKGSGTEYSLSALSACSLSQREEGAVLSGREQLGIKLIPPSQAVASGVSSSKQPSERSLLLRVRRDAVPLLPPVFSVLMVRPDAPAASSRGVLVWVRFHVDAKDGHTDANRCGACGDAGHAAASCSAARDGHRARFQVFATVPPVGAAVSVGSGHQLTLKPHAAGGKQQQVQQRAQQPAVFITASGSRRSVNQQLNQQAACASATGVTPSAPPAVTTSADVQPVETTSRQHKAQEAPTDPSVVEESEQLEKLRQLERGLQLDHERLAACLNMDEVVASDQFQQFCELQLAHSARRAELTAASTHACKAVAALTAVPALQSPKGKGKGGKPGVVAYEQKLKRFAELQAKRKTQLTTAQCSKSRLQALTDQYEAFAARLQQYHSVTLPLSSTELSLEVQSTAPQLTTDSCESPLSPIIAIPPDSQGTPAAVAAAALEVGPAVTAVAGSPQAAVRTARVAQHLQADSTQLELQRNVQFALRRDAFDAAEQTATDAEQRRLALAARSPVTAAQSCAVGSSAVQSRAADSSASQSRAAESSGAQPDAADSIAAQPSPANGSTVQPSAADSRAVRSSESLSAAVHSSTAGGNTGTPDTDEDSSSSGGSGSSESSESECSDAASERKLLKTPARKQQQQQQQATVTAVRAVTRALARSTSLPISN